MQCARFLGTSGLLLALGLAGFVAGCGSADGTKEGGGQVDPQAARQIEKSKREFYKEENKKKSNAFR